MQAALPTYVDILSKYWNKSRDKYLEHMVGYYMYCLRKFLVYHDVS